ncbi:MAG: hypothetical protein LUD78_02435 [Clostridiales bacterium]|nr:hypothetical protein [Clostridiales bacterium]
MLKDVTEIDLLGANFDPTASFSFFDPCDGAKVKTIKGTLLYGRNGTGKSTIAKAFRKLSGQDETAIVSANFRDNSGQIITLTEEEKKHIFVGRL